MSQTGFRLKKFLCIVLCIVKNCKGMGICLQGASQEFLLQREGLSAIVPAACAELKHHLGSNSRGDAVYSPLSEFPVISVPL